ncbi:MAG: Dabb family protein [Pseudomonadota bacterium]
MIQHVTLIDFKAGTTDAQKAAVLAAFQTLPDHIAEIRDFRAGLDLSLLEGNAGIAVHATFDSPEDFLAYSSHGAHMEVIYPVCGDVMAGYSTAQIAL